MRKAILLMLLGLTLSWGAAMATEALATPAVSAPAAATPTLGAVLPAGPLDGVIFLLPANCPRLCNLTNGTSCTGNPLTEPCYDTVSRTCSTCNCGSNYKWSCFIGS